MKPKENQEEFFTTRDLYLAATLVTLKFPVDCIDFQVEGARPQPVGYFNFVETEALLDTADAYQSRKVTVEPQEFVTNMRSLKARVMGTYKAPRTDYSKFMR